MEIKFFFSLFRVKEKNVCILYFDAYFVQEINYISDKLIHFEYLEIYIVIREPIKVIE